MTATVSYDFDVSFFPFLNPYQGCRFQPPVFTTAVREPPALYFTPHVSQPHKPLRLLVPLARLMAGGRATVEAVQGHRWPAATRSSGHSQLVSLKPEAGGRVGGGGVRG